MFTRRFKRFMKSNKGRKFQKMKELKLESTKEKDPIIFYECKKPRHIKFDCPQWKKKGSSKEKHKANVATWSDEDSSDDEDQEIANLCLMAINDSKWLRVLGVFGTSQVQALSWEDFDILNKALTWFNRLIFYSL
ncbi:hypothetical protein J1N35_011136 [Gossypium stocksii]|uniref:CCHC-type domain-containing protein n=1 Tax=Gossypium stocksii TaxID=47602 RepID=A0A9D4ACX3_9ROSI|nr:hypothetical protein J1N35_011136 [Gossypium stocksii]